MSLPTSIHPFLITGNDANQYKIANSLRFRSSNSAYLSRTPATSSSDPRTWTFSAWVKRGALSSTQSMISAGSSAASTPYETQCYISSSDTLIFVWNGNGGGIGDNFQSAAVFRDPGSWYHIVLKADLSNATRANRLILYVNGVLQTLTLVGSGGNSSTTSWLNSSHPMTIGKSSYTSANYFDGYLSEVNFIDGQALTPSSFGYTDTLTNQWMPKRYTGTYGTNGFYLPFNNTTTQTSENKVTYSEAFDDASWAKPAGPVAPTVTANAIAAPNGTTTADRLEFSGSTAHPVYKEYSFTITNGSTVTTSVYLKNYIAGSYNLQCFIFTPTHLDSYTNIVFDSNGILTSCTPIGGDAANTIAEFYDVGNGWYRVVCRHTNNSGSSEGGCRISIGQNGISGASGVYAWGAQMELSPTVGPYFATTSSAQSSTLQIGRDESSNKVAGWNNWAASGISLTSGTTYDVLKDVPVSWDDGGTGRGNYCTMPVFDNSGQTWTSSEGNLRLLQGNSGSYVYTVKGTIAVNTGKWYFETYINAVGAGNDGGVGIIDTSWLTGSTSFSVSPTVWYYRNNGYIYQGTNGSGTNTQLQTTGVTTTAGDLIGVAFDVDAKTISFYKNGSIMGTSQAFTLTTGNYVMPAHRGYYNSDWSFNFGQRPFSYTPPAGYKALNSYNLQNPSLPLV
jgi:hypothetical protein